MKIQRQEARLAAQMKAKRQREELRQAERMWQEKLAAIKTDVDQ